MSCRSADILPDEIESPGALSTLRARCRPLGVCTWLNLAGRAVANLSPAIRRLARDRQVVELARPGAWARLVCGSIAMRMELVHLKQETPVP